MTRYRPTVTLRIPPDIEPQQHDSIIREIRSINMDLSRFSCVSPSRALERAAIALDGSHSSACGLASYKREVVKL